jgi:hypothetical protein
MRTACVCALISLCVACGDDTTGSGGVGSGGSPATGGGEVGGAPEGGAPAGGAGGDGPAPPCEVHCALLDTLEAEANCGYDGSGCVPNCETDAAADCGTELLGLYACLDEQPGTDFVCVDGTFTLQGGACDAEAGVLTTCLQQ